MTGWYPAWVTWTRENAGHNWQWLYSVGHPVWSWVSPRSHVGGCLWSWSPSICTSVGSGSLPRRHKYRWSYSALLFGTDGLPPSLEQSVYSVVHLVSAPRPGCYTASTWPLWSRRPGRIQRSLVSTGCRRSDTATRGLLSLVRICSGCHDGSIGQGSGAVVGSVLWPGLSSPPSEWLVAAESVPPRRCHSCKGWIALYGSWVRTVLVPCT